MKKTENFENTQAYGDFEVLPAGGYKCLIKKVECNEASNGKEFLKVLFDIAEGEYADFYKRKYTNDSRQDKKWSGVATIFTEGYEPNSTNPKFKGMITSVEESNAGYKWDWKEETLKDKKVGIVMREEEFEGQDGLVHVATKFSHFVSYDKAEGAKIPAIKKLPEKSDAFEGFQTVSGDTGDDLPF